MNNEDVHHVIESMDQLPHYDLNHIWRYLPLSCFHQFFEVASITKLYENIISSVCFNGFAHFYNILALHAILILYFRYNKSFFSRTQILSFNHFTGKKYWIWYLFHGRKLICRCIITTFVFSFVKKWRFIWNLLGKINFSILSLTEMSI